MKFLRRFCSSRLRRIVIFYLSAPEYKHCYSLTHSPEMKSGNDILKIIDITSRERDYISLWGAED